MSKESLTFALQDLLKPDEIDAAWKRTEYLQNKIVDSLKMEGIARQEGKTLDKTDLKEGQLFLYDDSDFDRLSLEKASKLSKLFYHACDARNNISIRVRINHAKQYHETEKNAAITWNASSIIQEETFQALKGYREGSAHGADRIATGEKIIEKITGVSLRDEEGRVNQAALDCILSHVCINGIPYRHVVPGDLTQEQNYNRFINQLTGHLSDAMDEKHKPLDCITLLDSDGEHKSLSYIPPSPTPFQGKKPGFFTWNKEEKLRIYEEQKAAYDKALAAAKDRNKMWDSRNNDQFMQANEMNNQFVSKESNGKRIPITLADLANDITKKAAENSNKPKPSAIKPRAKQNQMSAGK